MTEHDKSVLDLSAFAIFAGVLGNIIPSIVGIFTLIWLGIRIYESDTVRDLLGKEKK